MVKCPHAASGCNYPEGQCPGHCHYPADDGLCEPAYLTIVYRITEPRQPRALLEQAEWSAASHSHAIHERDQLAAELNDVQDQRRAAFRTIERLNDELGQVCEQRDELLRVLRMARAQLAVNLKELIDCHRDPITGGVDEREVLLIVESEQDLLNQIGDAIAKAGGAA